GSDGKPASCPLCVGGTERAAPRRATSSGRGRALVPHLKTEQGEEHVSGNETRIGVIMRKHTIDSRRLKDTGSAGRRPAKPIAHQRAQSLPEPYRERDAEARRRAVWDFRREIPVPALTQGPLPPSVVA